MRRIVIAEMLILGLWALYLGIVLTQASGNEVKHASAWGQTRSQSEFPFSPNTKVRETKASHPAGACPFSDRKSHANSGKTIGFRWLFCQGDLCGGRGHPRCDEIPPPHSVPVAAKEMQDYQLTGAWS